MRNRAHCAIGLLALGLVYTGSTWAQTVITPPEIAAQGQHFVASFTVSPSDDSIALSVDIPNPQGLFTQNIWTMPRQATTSQQITTLADETVGSAFDPAWNATGFVAYMVKHELLPPGATVLPGPELAVSTFGNLTSTGIHVRSFSWSPTQDTLVFLGQDDTQFAIDGADNGLYTIALHGTTPTKILSCHPPCGGPAWAPSENVIAYTGATLGTTTTDIHLINPNGSGDHVAIADAAGPVWSSAGTGLIAFQCGDDVCVASQDGAGRVNLTNGQGGLVFSEPSWSSNESLIAVIGRQPVSGAPGDLFVVKAGGTDPPLQLTNTLDARAPQWSPILATSDQTGSNSNPLLTTSQPSFELFYICTRNFSDELCLFTGVGIPPTGCDSNCPGCCSGGVCLPGTTATACGLHGTGCATCTGGKVCGATGDCQDPSFCGISSCSGCCDASSVCHSPPSVKTCGKDGDPCAPCFDGEYCDGVEGTCKRILCDAFSCPNSCCLNGKCQPNGQSDSSCGTSGQVCDICTGNAHCSTNRWCEIQTTPCTSGCRDSNGQCQSGRADNACGYGGGSNPCIDCAGQGEVCDANLGQCISSVPCSCPTGPGCCDANNECRGGNTPDACGFGGQSCDVCTGQLQCFISAGLGYSCQIRPAFP